MRHHRVHAGLGDRFVADDAAVERDHAVIEYLPPQLCHERLRRELAQEELVLRPDGTIPVPVEPGLGVEIDWDVVKRYKVA
jgi:L-alanine-DL-glutamate epimerase-like enolase superfamily enzyme